MQRPYTGLAQIYDYLLSGVDYEEWADYLEDIFRSFQVHPLEKVVDLACGTGNSTFPWAKRGFTVWGVDISPEMLHWAREKAEQQTLEVAFFQEDLREMKRSFDADAAVLYQDGLNYMLTYEDLERALRAINFALRPGGYFVFNLNQVEKLPVSQQPETAMLEEENMVLIWESYFKPERKTWVIVLTAFLRTEDGLYKKFKEEHQERSYTRDELEPLLARTGWAVQACYRAFSFERPGPADRNIFYVLQKQGEPPCTWR